MFYWNVEKVRNRIAQILSLKGISDREFSRRLGKNDSYMNKIMNGKIGLSMGSFLKMCEVLEINPSDFFSVSMDTKTVTGKIIRFILRLTLKEQELLLHFLEEFEHRWRGLIEKTAPSDSTSPKEDEQQKDS